MKCTLHLIFILLMSYVVKSARPTQTIYVDSSTNNYPGNGSPGNPYATLDLALSNVDNGDTVTIYVSPSAVAYNLDQTYDFTNGTSITFQTTASKYTPGSYLKSESDCSLLPVFFFQQSLNFNTSGSISASFLSFNGIALFGDSSYFITILTISAQNLFFFDSCQTFNNSDSYYSNMQITYANLGGNLSTSNFSFSNVYFSILGRDLLDTFVITLSGESDPSFNFNLSMVNTYFSSTGSLSPQFLNIQSGVIKTSIINFQSQIIPRMNLYTLDITIENWILQGNDTLKSGKNLESVIRIDYYTSVRMRNITMSGFNIEKVAPIFIFNKEDPEYLNLDSSPNVNPAFLNANQNITLDTINLLSNNISSDYSWQLVSISITNANFNGYLSLKNVNITQNSFTFASNNTVVVFFLGGLYYYNISNVYFYQNQYLGLISTEASRAYESRLLSLTNGYFAFNHWAYGTSIIMNFKENTFAPLTNIVSSIISNLTILNNKLEADFIHYYNGEYTPSTTNYYIRSRALVSSIVLQNNNITDSNFFIINGFTLDFFDVISKNDKYIFSSLLQSLNFESPISIQNLQVSNCSLNNSILIYKQIDSGVLINLIDDSVNSNIAVPFSLFVTFSNFSDINAYQSTIIEANGIPIFLVTNTSFINMGLSKSQILNPHDLFSSISQVQFSESLLNSYSDYLSAIQNQYLTIAMSQSLNIPGDDVYQLGIYFSNNLFVYRVYGINIENIYMEASNFFLGANVGLNVSGVAIDTIHFENYTMTLLADVFVSLTNVYKFRLWNSNITKARGLGTFLSVIDSNYLYLKNLYFHDNIGTSFISSAISQNNYVEFRDILVNNTQTTTTYIHLSIIQNLGYIKFLNCKFLNIFLSSDPEAYQQINFLLLDTQSSQVTNGVPSVYLYNCEFSNITLLKNHNLIKQYQNSLIVTLLSQDLLWLENFYLYNISVLYDSDTMMLVSQNIMMNNLTMNQTYNYDVYGALYILAVSFNLSNSNFVDNYSPNSQGGALYIDFDSIDGSLVNVLIANSNFYNNIAQDGAAIYYSQRKISFTAINNYFYGCEPLKYAGSIITFYNATFEYFNMTNNTLYFDLEDQVFMRFLSFSMSNVSSNNVQINFIDTNIYLATRYKGQIFATNYDKPGVVYNFNTINLVELNSTATYSHNMNLLYVASGNVNLFNTSISGLRPLSSSLIETTCLGNDIYLTILNCSFTNLNITEKNSLLSSSTYNPLGVVRIDSVGGNTACNQEILIHDVNISYLNYNATLFSNVQRTKLTTVPPSSAVLVDYQGNFELNIVRSTFSYIFSYRGAAINIQNSVSTNFTTLLITKSNFNNLISYLEGGAIYSLQNTSVITNSSFFRVFSLRRNGPAYFCGKAINESAILNYGNNTFNTTQGYASYSFRTNYSLGTSPRTMVPFFSPTKNSGIQVKLINGSYYLLNITSAVLSHLNISIHLVDDLGQLVYDDYFQGSFSKGFTLTTQNKFVDTKNCDYYGCTMIKPYLPVKGLANQNLTFTLSYKSLDDFKVPDFTFYGFLRPCLIGELNYSQTGECYLCPSGSFSFNTSDLKCSKCPKHVNCSGGAYLQLSEGYWRENTTSDLIFECNITGACLGGYNSTCLSGYTGPLCSSCDGTLGWVSNGETCSQCPNSGISLILTIITTLFTMAYQVWFVKTVRTSNKMYGNQNKRDQDIKTIDMKISQGIYVRLLTTYLQIFTLISTFNINFSSLISGISTGSQIVANPSSTVFYSSLCSLLDAGADPQFLLYYQVGFTALLTPFKIIVVCIYRLFYWRFDLKRNTNKNRIPVLIITAVCIFILDQPNVFKVLVGFIACVQLDPNSPSLYIQEDLQYSCNTPEYSNFVSYMVIPAMLLYAVVIPGFFFLKLVKNRKNLDDEKIRLSYGALYNEYTEGAFYWGIVLMILKLVLMYMGSILFGDIKTKALSIFVILMIYYVLYVRIMPYRKDELFNAEKLALTSYLISIFGSIYYIDNTLTTMQWITAVLVVLINLYTVVIICRGMLILNIIKIKDILKPMLLNMIAKKEKQKRIVELRAMPNDQVVQMVLDDMKKEEKNREMDDTQADLITDRSEM